MNAVDHTLTRNVSIIVPITTKTVRVNQLIRRINDALSVPDDSQIEINNNYEIIFVTNTFQEISLEDIDITTGAIPVTMHIDQELKTKSALIQKGVSEAKYNTIMTIDASLELPKHSLFYMASNAEHVEVIAAFPKRTKQEIEQKEVQFEELSDAAFLTIQRNPKAGALIFARNVWEFIYPTLNYDKAYIVEFLYKASEAGFFVARYNLLIHQNVLLSRVSETKETIKAGLHVGYVKAKKALPLATPGSNDETMVNAGMRYNKKRFITHSTLSYHDSAITPFTRKQIFIIAGITLTIILGFLLNLILASKVIFTFLSILYLIDVFFNIYLLLQTIKGGSEIKFTQDEFDALKDENLPMYTILCPMYKEAHMLAPFLEGLEKIVWPKDKLDVIILLEEDDKESIETIGKMDLPSHVRMLVVPSSQPQTKPKACNYGLAYSKGEYIVIFDAEDIPDPMQLKKAYIGFQKSDRKIVCLQAKLNYHNSTQNLLTRFFTAEYSWLFDVSLPGLQSLNTIIPLGGTSNHFRKEDLIKLNGWDSFNVTEDADLGMRIFKKGYRTGIIDSVTLEEANSNVYNWIRQRSRWIKGYMQTYLVHTRETLPFVKQRGWQALMLHFVIGGKILFIFVNPLLWLVTIAYFTLHGVFGTVIEQSYSPEILYSAVFCLVVGNYSYLVGYIMACVKREHWGLIKYVYLLPMYLLLISIAGCMAFYQLLFKPYYWEKTVHGLHLVQKTENPSV